MSGHAAAAGSSWFEGTDDGWDVSLDDEATAEVAAVYQKLIDEDLIKVVGRWDTAFTDALVGGEIIGTVGAGWEPAFFLGDLGQEETSWEVAHLPAFDADNPSTGPDGGSGIAVVKGCEHPEEALKVADWYNTQVPDLVSQGLVVAATTEGTADPGEHQGALERPGRLRRPRRGERADEPRLRLWAHLAGGRRGPERDRSDGL